jgi:glycosyltransferase involved in cell wall biosynthesis
MPSAKYVCGFRGRRDSYQVPLALAEAGLLEEFVTDAYAKSPLKTLASWCSTSLAEKINARYAPGIPEDRVRCVWRSAAEEILGLRFRSSPSELFAKLDRDFGSAVALRARATKGNLFVYSHHAWEPFTTHYEHDPRKIMFQFHPHPDTERQILENDLARFPTARASYEEEIGALVTESLRLRVSDSWRHADLILCASSFTRRSVENAGADPKICKVIPYGIELGGSKHFEKGCQSYSKRDRFTVLFVGTGNQRKGLHHLLRAWEIASLPAGSQLVLVCRVIHPFLDEMVQRAQNVEVLRSVTNERLTQLFRTSSLMAMPSLVEGFGQVYLEALAQGCPVLGTPNTGLPDLKAEDGPIWQVEAGQVDELVSLLERLAGILPRNLEYRRSARACAARWSWDFFRAQIKDTVAA